MLIQKPAPGEGVVRFTGDTITFELLDHDARHGSAWLRTNLMGAHVKRREIIEAVELGNPPLDRDWFDVAIPMIEPGRYSIAVPLKDAGTFEAKTFFLPDSEEAPVWPEGGNVTVKVEPACCKAGNSIYSAFVRLFGEELKSDRAKKSSIAELDKAGYTVIPRSGKFRDVIKKLDVIIGEMGFRNLLLLPIHPTPTTYARMGRFGSPFASLDFMDVDPALAEFDRKTTPLDQFHELIDACHARGASLFIDLPVNHTGWASALQVHHPSWFERSHTREFQSPGAWGVTWEDLTELNYDKVELWKYMADVFLFWCRQGVDGFRCDAGYMVPSEVWKYITAKVREQFPDTIFLLEGLGGKITTTHKLLTDANLNWAYSELFQNYTRWEIESYLKEADSMSSRTGALVHFAETHDNNRLASTSTGYASMRTTLCALLSRSGTFGITCGAEWFAAEKISVHDRTSLNWNSEENQIQLIRTLHFLLTTHPVFTENSTLEMIHTGHSNTLAVLRTCNEPKASALILVNLDHNNPSVVEWPQSAGFAPDDTTDLLSGKSVSFEKSNGSCRTTLNPAQVLCLSSTHDFALQKSDAPFVPSKTNALQKAKTKALEILLSRAGRTELPEASPSSLAVDLMNDPHGFCEKYAGNSNPTHVVNWNWPADINRTVPVPAGSLILVKAPFRFHVDMIHNDRVIKRSKSLQSGEAWFTVLTETSEFEGKAFLHIALYETTAAHKAVCPILLLKPLSSKTAPQITASAEEVRRLNRSALCTNERGAMSLVRGAWGEIRSQYDALLAANIHTSAPVDRQVMITRCRAWLVLRGYSQEINADCLTSFSALQPGSAEWNFSIPTGMGKRVPLRIELNLQKELDSIDILFHRIHNSDGSDLLESSTPVKLILRVDLEDRSFHHKTKAFMGPEEAWAKCVYPEGSGFVFYPHQDRKLSVSTDKGTFTHEPEWLYMVSHPLDAERGLEPNGDMFSPGFFSIDLNGSDQVSLNAHVNGDYAKTKSADKPAPANNLSGLLKTAMKQFVVKRDKSKTVIAGYPWFLDWGRDTLICLRGMISQGMLDDASDILIQFASFEERGTIPNMIRGNDVSNRDTSDAPLWLFAAASDLTAAKGPDFIKTDCSGRTLKDVLTSIADNYIAGTPNGIKMDPASGLIFSPSHYTWMDTNHPAGTPREGYPVEIQALWYCALELMEKITGDSKWTSLKQLVRRSIHELFYSPTLKCLSDCLHCRPGAPAAEAVKDDHLRPNQLFAITLGAIDDQAICREIISACQSLLVPGAIRTLADRPVDYALPVIRNGHSLNDPHHPYWGAYTGDEDTRRKPAYHNGTAWTWPFPSYCEAMVKVNGRAAKDSALAYLSGMLEILNSNCIGQIPEILDGNTPHTEKGCTAQAWGVSEFARVLAILEQIQ